MTLRQSHGLNLSQLNKIGSLQNKRLPFISLVTHANLTHQGEIATEMKLKLYKTIPGFDTDESLLFTYPSRVTDLYVPDLEKVIVPVKHYPEFKLGINVYTGSTEIRKPYGLKGKINQAFEKVANKIEHIDAGEEFIFDARYDTDKNVSHLIQNLIAPSILVRNEISEALDKPISLNVVLRKNTSNISVKAFKLMGFEVIQTEGTVQGNIIKLDKCEDQAYFGIIPEVFNVDFDGYTGDTPEKVFIPRQGTRSIENNAEIQSFLETRGFKTFYFEELTLEEEWSIARNAKVVVAANGAAWAHFAFNKLGYKNPGIPGSGVKMIVLVSPNFNTKFSQRIAKVINGRRAAVRGQLTPKALKELDFKQRSYSPHLSPMSDPYKIHLKSLEEALAYLGER